MRLLYSKLKKWKEGKTRYLEVRHDKEMVERGKRAK